MTRGDRANAARAATDREGQDGERCGEVCVSLQGEVTRRERDFVATVAAGLAK